MNDIVIKNAYEGNLRHIAVRIPRDQFVVVTGVSGSGKTTLVNDVLYTECQRQYLEAVGYQGFRKPKVDSVDNASPTVRVTQGKSSYNLRSTVGTLTNIYAELRMIFEKLGERACPACHETRYAYECREEVIKEKHDFHVYEYCSKCHAKVDRVTRSHFSFNTREGACPNCQGIGTILAVDWGKTLDPSLSFEGGAVRFLNSAYSAHMAGIYYAALEHFHIPYQAGTKLEDYSEDQLLLFKHGAESSEIKERFPDIKAPGTMYKGKFEGIQTILWRKIAESGGTNEKYGQYFKKTLCPVCEGEKLNSVSRLVTVCGQRLPEISALSLDKVGSWLQQVKDSYPLPVLKAVDDYLLDTKTKADRIVKTGLSYLGLNRQTMTLSGGEIQRLKLAALLDSRLSGVIYLLDEPTIGLHPSDTQGLIGVLIDLKRQGNTVMVIEHDEEVIRAADFLIDMGPGAGVHGGEVTAVGTFEEIMQQPGSVTGRYFAQVHPPLRHHRAAKGMIEIQHASMHNIQDLSVRIPKECLTVVSGVSGAGKSTLVFDILAKGGGGAQILGLDSFEDIIVMDQNPAATMKRSSVATYTGVFSEIRKIYANLPLSKQHTLTPGDFSFNTPGGRCENCQGMGTVTSNLLFFEEAEVECPVCQGQRFTEKILEIIYHDKNITELLNLSVLEVWEMFPKGGKLGGLLDVLMETGLGYLVLGQSLTTLSAGELQRLRLANALQKMKKGNRLLIMDEPTAGLHPLDIERFLKLCGKLVDSGNTLILVEHNLQVIAASDYLIDLGPGGGEEGGKLIFAGETSKLSDAEESLTGKYLKAYLEKNGGHVNASV